MKYKFPQIQNISDVLPAIAGASEFIVAEREQYRVINYMVSLDTTFPEVTDELSAIRRECRGLIFCSRTGKLISRAFHKFFNIGEKPETQLDQCEISPDALVLEKLDGSFIRAIPLADGYRLATKMGAGTDVAMQAEVFVASRSNLDQLFRDLVVATAGAVTPIFEWCSRYNRIVLDYPEPRLVLTAVRDTVSGRYWTRAELEDLAAKYNLELVSAAPFSDLAAVRDQCRLLEQAEGYVVREPDGHMIKIKSDWYVALHRTLDRVRFEKDVLAIVLDNSLDDVRAVLLPTVLADIEVYNRAVWQGIQKTASEILPVIQAARAASADRKTYAVEHCQKQSVLVQRIMYQFWEIDPSTELVTDAVVKLIQNNISTQAKLDSVRALFGARYQEKEVQ
jgi:T4 RnlA family RNA ligase